MTENFRVGHAVDFQDLTLPFTLDSATEFLFGTSVHSLRAPLLRSYSSTHNSFADHSPSSNHATAEAFAHAVHEVEVAYQSARHMHVIDELLNPIIEKALKMRYEKTASDKSVDEDEEETFLDHLLTYEDIKDMKYLHALINETLHLYPIVHYHTLITILRPFNSWFSVNAATILNPDPNGKPIYIPPNTLILYQPFIMHHRTEYWGPDAMEFDPDRFLDERLQKYLLLNLFIFLPFNAGPHICLRQQFAYNEASFFLIKLLQRFMAMELDLSAQPVESLPPVHWVGSWGRQGIEKVWLKVHIAIYAEGAYGLR
ncbi:cytochrome P450 [Laetiporus sulphureus 93-53]|uniref:Cytochrome P450 n=1 Tax=Laetiporus sulphureus 93-53 TaxID=1314785 RepID=A0A165BXE1_9APHY|nr:cytochrome P450 [Laetiporus sulphureus 93-53]KZT01826.1 cytochrome P450 [Laetiporus sulphureus 93-53]